jgi:hypothetical protein
MFWLHNPTILFHKDQIHELYPMENMKLDRKLNAITRLVILLTTIGFLYTRSVRLLLTSVITLVVIAMVYKPEEKREAFHVMKEIMKEATGPTKNNPMMNVMYDDYNEPDRPAAMPAYNPIVEQKINDAVRENLDERIFRDLGDEIIFEHSMRQFYTMPNTQIPNDQEAFQNFLYGAKGSCRGGDFWECGKPQHTMR